MRFFVFFFFSFLPLSGEPVATNKAADRRQEMEQQTSEQPNEVVNYADSVFEELQKMEKYIDRIARKISQTKKPAEKPEKISLKIVVNE